MNKNDDVQHVDFHIFIFYQLAKKVFKKFTNQKKQNKKEYLDNFFNWGGDSFFINYWFAVVYIL